ncbi:hypothetical protein [Streptomyces sp. NPDC056921]|uniref:hypothetical protein n=1 Tax=Streptomyces sp. NPDC056921 TaxID=3345966 RepID=UPI00363AA06B
MNWASTAGSWSSLNRSTPAAAQLTRTQPPPPHPRPVSALQDVPGVLAVVLLFLVVGVLLAAADAGIDQCLDGVRVVRP